jgi:hypothetical protein
MTQALAVLPEKADDLPVRSFERDRSDWVKMLIAALVVFAVATWYTWC